MGDLDHPFTSRGDTWTSIDAGVRVVEWIRADEMRDVGRPGRWQEQRWSEGQRAWIPTGRTWDEHTWDERAWRTAHPAHRRGPLPCFVPDGVFLLLGTVRRQPYLWMGDHNDEAPVSWPLGRFSMQHQCAGYGMAQALLDGAFFLIPPDDASPFATGLRGLAGPYELHDLTDAGADEVAAKVGGLLQATAFPSDFDAPCGEALHWFRLDDGVVQRITAAFLMVAEVHPYEIAALTTAPFSTVAELSAWRGVPEAELVAAFVYGNCD